MIGGSAFGELSASTVKLFKDLVAASSTGISVSSISGKFSAGILFCSGHVIAEAERRVGVVHSASPLQTVQSITIGRKGTVGRAVENDDDIRE